jgi:hypothetical protein
MDEVRAAQMCLSDIERNVAAAFLLSQKSPERVSSLQACLDTVELTVEWVEDLSKAVASEASLRLEVARLLHRLNRLIFHVRHALSAEASEVEGGFASVLPLEVIAPQAASAAWYDVDTGRDLELALKERSSVGEICDDMLALREASHDLHKLVVRSLTPAVCLVGLKSLSGLLNRLSLTVFGKLRLTWKTQHTGLGAGWNSLRRLNLPALVAQPRLDGVSCLLQAAKFSSASRTKEAALGGAIAGGVTGAVASGSLKGAVVGAPVDASG